MASPLMSDFKGKAVRMVGAKAVPVVAVLKGAFRLRPPRAARKFRSANVHTKMVSP